MYLKPAKGMLRIFMQPNSSFQGKTYFQETALDVSKNMALHLVATGAAVDKRTLCDECSKILNFAGEKHRCV